MKRLGKMLSCAALAAVVGTVGFAGSVATKATAASFDTGETFYVEKASGQDFVILQLTDTHVQNKLHGEKDVFPVIQKWVNQIQPDMIVLTGDGVNGTTDGNDMRALITEMSSYGIPWAYVFGNHEKDASGGVPAMSAILKEEMTREGSPLMYAEGPFTSEGRYGNYVVNIEQKGKLINSLFFFDTGREYETFLPSQTDWYAEGVKTLSESYYGEYAPFEGNVIPSMVFHHVPTDEYQYAANSVLTGEMTITEEDATQYTYEHVKIGKVPSKYGSGTNNEIAYGQRDARVKNARIHNTEADKSLLEYCMYDDPRSEAGFFSVAKDLHSTTHMFCGHRHSNNASILYEGITLTFGTKTGPGNANADVRTGCTVITIENRTNKISVAHKYD